jgi:hypothetical protein
LAGELLKAAPAINSACPARAAGGLPDLLSGRVSMMIETIPNALPAALRCRCARSA